MKQSKKQLIAVFRDILNGLENDDSFQGNISYDAMVDGLEREEFEVTGCYRVGNSMGQGGVVLLPSAADAE